MPIEIYVGYAAVATIVALPICLYLVLDSLAKRFVPRIERERGFHIRKF